MRQQQDWECTQVCLFEFASWISRDSNDQFYHAVILLFDAKLIVQCALKNKANYFVA